MLVQNHIFHKRSYFRGWNKIHKHHPLVLTLDLILQKRICNTSKNTLMMNTLDVYIMNQTLIQCKDGYLDIYWYCMFQLVKIDRCMSPWILCWAPADVSWNVCPRRRFYYRFQYPTHSTSSLLLLFQRVNWLVIYMVGYFKFDNSYHQNIFANIITWRKRMRISCFGCANIRYNNFAFFYPRKKEYEHLDIT